MMKYIGQVFLIVFSVVLGLYLSERIEERKNTKDAEKLLSKIKSELNDNIKILDYWVPYHGEVVNRIDSLSKDEKFIENFVKDKSTLYKAFSRTSLMSETPSKNAWDIAKSHPLIVNFDYDDLFVLSKIYNQQETTFEGLPKMIELLLTPDFNSRENAKSNLQLFRNQLGDIYSRELQLVRYYNNGEELLKFRSN